MSIQSESKRGEVHLGDLARALRRLQCDSSEQVQLVASCLGFFIQEEAKLEVQTEIYDTHRYPEETDAKKELAKPPRRFPLPPRPDAPINLPKQVLPSTLESLDIRSPPIASDPAGPEGGYKMLDENAGYPAIARSTLFKENTSRGIFSAALATQREGVEVDIQALIAATVRGTAVQRIPRLQAATLAKGCQLLLDYRSSMVPLFEDLALLQGQISEIVPSDKIEVFTFDTDPSAAKRWTADLQSIPWMPEQRPVLVATDFGIQGRGGRAASPTAWRPFVRQCQENGSPLLVLIPWPHQRWPIGLGRYPELIHWSAFTTAAMIRRKIGLGHVTPV